MEEKSLKKECPILRFLSFVWRALWFVLDVVFYMLLPILGNLAIFFVPFLLGVLIMKRTLFIFSGFLPAAILPADHLVTGIAVCISSILLAVSAIKYFYLDSWKTWKSYNMEARVRISIILISVPSLFWLCAVLIKILVQ